MRFRPETLFYNGNTLVCAKLFAPAGIICFRCPEPRSSSRMASQQTVPGCRQERYRGELKSTQDPWETLAVPATLLTCLEYSETRCGGRIAKDASGTHHVIIKTNNADLSQIHTLSVDIAGSEHSLTHPTVSVALLTFRRTHQGLGDTMWRADNRR